MGEKEDNPSMFFANNCLPTDMPPMQLRDEWASDHHQITIACVYFFSVRTLLTGSNISDALAKARFSTGSRYQYGGPFSVNWLTC